MVMVKLPFRLFSNHYIQVIKIGLFYLYATAKSKIPICSNDHETGLVLALIYFMKRTMERDIGHISCS